MKIEDEVRYRAAISVDFLASLLDDQGEFVAQFKNGKPDDLKCTLMYHLHATSVLYTAADFLGTSEWKKVADRAFGKLGLLTFSKFDEPKNKHVVNGDKSLTCWNCMASIIHRKRHEPKIADLFAKAVLTCIDNENTYSIYPTTQPSNTIIGYIILCLLHACEHAAADVEYLEAAKEAAQIELKSPILTDHYATIALAQLDISNERYKERINRAISNFDRFDVQSMNSLFAAMAQQLYIPVRHKRERIEEVFEIQRELQVDKDHSYGLSSEFHGAFVSSKLDQNIRIDYVIHNAIALMQMVAYLENKPLPMIL